MNNVYDYKNNTNVITTPNGDKVITLNEQIYTEILNHIYDAAEYQKSKGHNATADRTMALWKELNDEYDER